MLEDITVEELLSTRCAFSHDIYLDLLYIHLRTLDGMDIIYLKRLLRE